MESLPPPGEVTDVLNPESISWAGRLSIHLTLPIMVVAFIMRSIVRFRARQIGIDAYLLILGVISAASFCGILFPIFVQDVWGRHQWNTPLISIKPWFFQYSVTAGCIYNISALFTKTSLLALYFQVFRPSRLARSFIWFGITVISIMYIAVTVAMLAYMLPRPGDGGWGSMANTQRMGIPSRIIDLTQGFFGAFSDIYVLVIPIVVVSGLQVPLKKKIGLTGIFLTGLISCGYSVAGVIFRYQALYFEVDDHRWLSIKFEALCVAEVNIGILCACIPVFFVLFKPAIRKAETVFVYLKGRLSPRANKENAATDVTALPPPEILKQVPSGTLSGLKSFFRKVGHTQDRESEKTATSAQISQCTDLQ
ncbi:hypothetical protein PG997_009088 [Apiospora hydei]|uniref:Rhodopsin domain-containing protein n=1 Tax=Apiospora hydei TaxID=1337664 RepID=A0ABR1VT47_9PEZI